MSRLSLELREHVRKNLVAFERLACPLEGRRPAAVALVLTDDAVGEACFILTRRATHLGNHGGQWALPGGRIETGEDAPAAALRELREEVGLDLEAGSLLGELDDYPTRSGFVITPVVFWRGPDVRLEPDPGEVAEVHRVRLAVLDEPGVPRLRRIPQSDRPVISIPLAGAQVHAPTAALVFQLREVALHGRDTRVAHFEQPVFAWR